MLHPMVGIGLLVVYVPLLNGDFLKNVQDLGQQACHYLHYRIFYLGGGHHLFKNFLILWKKNLNDVRKSIGKKNCLRRRVVFEAIIA